MRLQKYLAQCGVASRRQAEQYIEAGRVSVNGNPAAIGDSVTPGQDRVLFDNKPVAADNHVYILLNKPTGVVTSAKDDRRRKTVLDCIEGIRERLYPVGRLDLDVEGALLLTNDGDLAYRLMHPKYEIDKVYVAQLEGCITPDTAARMKSGIELEDGLARAADVKIVKVGEKKSMIRLVMREGRKREVKRLCLAAGHIVRSLKRISVANLHVKGLRPGEWRHLTDMEVAKLRRVCGLS